MDIFSKGAASCHSPCKIQPLCYQYSFVLMRHALRAQLPHLSARRLPFGQAQGSRHFKPFPPACCLAGFKCRPYFPCAKPFPVAYHLAGFAQALRTTAPIHRGRPHPLRSVPPVTAVSFPMFPAAGNTRSGFATASYKRATPALPTTTNVKNPNKT